MKHKGIIPLFTFVFMVFLPLYAQPDNPEECGKHKRFVEELNLTDEQHTQLKLLKLDMQKEHILHFDEVKKTREKIKEELLKEKPSQGKLNEYAKELGKLHGKLEEKRLAHFLKVKEVFTKEQFEKLLSKEFMYEMRKQWRGKGKGKDRKVFDDQSHRQSRQMPRSRYTP